MRSILSLLVVAVIAGAQEPAKEGRDERVQVLLKNGHQMIGIAKAGIRCERLVRGNFKPGDDPTDRSSGIRVWYYQDLDGYIFLETRTLERVEVLGTLTSEESRALSEAIAAAHGSRIDAPSSRPSTTTAKPVAGSDSRPAPQTDPNGLTAAEKVLLDRFPPDKGWCPEKFGELQRKKIVLHVNPSDEEQAFIDDFPAFQGAWRKWLAVQPPKPDAEVKADEPAEGNRRNGRK
jgi:hypothetical protein